VQVSVALVGPGAIGERHLWALREAGARVDVIVGADDAEASGFAAQYGIVHSYSRLEEALGRTDIDAVVIATPSQLHAGQTAAALASGRPVLCEVPCALSLNEAVRLLELSGATGNALMIAHTYRFAAPYAALRDRIEDGGFAVRHLVWNQLNLRQENVGWTGRQRTWTDDVLWHHGGHAVDLALWYLGTDDVVVHGRSGPEWSGNGNHMDVAAVLEAPDGDLATLALSYHSRKPTNSFLVIGEEHTFSIDNGVLEMDGSVLLDTGGFDVMMRAAMVAQARDFLAVVADGQQPRFSITDALPTMRVLDQLQSKGR
jgi:2-hydroxy-4-carboxymuconate semialdehyde hemiacetal dehydrogenase